MKRMKFLLTVAIMLFVSVYFISAQQRTLEGVVTDESGNPIPGVTVTPKGLDQSVNTDAIGHYSLPNVPDTILTLVFTHPEMETASASVGIYNKVDVVMVQKGSDAIVEFSLEDLLNMDVTTASKSAEKQSDAPGIITVLTNDELKRFGGTTLTDILNRVPGLIRHTTSWTNRTTIAVRGDQIKSNSAHVLILINGRPVREVQEAGISSDIFETFPINIIERIEVIKGPGSVLYGSDAFSGVINIITEKAEKNTLSLSGLVGTEGGHGGNGDGTVKIGDLGITVGGRYLKKADFKPTYYTTTGGFFNPRDTSYTLDIVDKGGGGFLGLNYKGLSVMSTYNEWTASGVSYADDTRLRKNFHNLGYNLKASESWNMDFNFTYTHSEMFLQTLLERKCNNIVAEWTNFFKVGNKFNAVVGGLYSNSNGTVEQRTTLPDSTYFVCDGKLGTYGLYAQADYKLFKSLKLIGGMQLNKVGDLDMSVTPRGGIVWYPLKKLSLKLLYSEAFRAPSINELYVANPGYIYGNENLDPEKVKTIDVGLSYQAGQAQLGANFFYSKQSDIITYVFDFATFTSNYVNLPGEYEFIGGEFEGKYYVNNKIYVDGSVLYQNNKRDTIKNIMPLSNLGIKAGISYMNDDNGITVSLFNIYQGDLDSKFKDANSPGQGAYNLMSLHTNFIINKIFSMSFKPQISLFINIDNVVGKEIYLSGGSGAVAIPTYPGRRIYFGLNVAL